MLGGEGTEPIRGVQLQVPSLRRVSLRPPFMHDGRSQTLEEAVHDMIATTTTVEPLTENVAALTAYMRTL
jgi:cytochrome c peroxidase